jgi:hypothetical protein
VDPAEILDRFDAEIRADPPTEVGVERAWADGVLRTTGAYNYIGWWDFPPAEVGAAVAREAAFFREKGVQWKVYSHDGPPELVQALQRNGFEEEEVETFLVFDMAAAMPDLAPPAGIEVRQVRDRAGVADLLTVAEAAFGKSEPSRLETFTARLSDPTLALFVAYDHGVPVSSGRIELAPGRAGRLSRPGRRPRHRSPPPRPPLSHRRRSRDQPRDPGAARLRRAGHDPGLDAAGPRLTGM